MSPTSFGMILGLVVGLGYVAYVLFSRPENPNLGDFGKVFIGCVTAVVSVAFGWKCNSVDLSCLPDLKDHRLVMTLGSIALAWLSISQVAAVFGWDKHFQRNY